MDPSDHLAYSKLIEIWSKNPEKNQQVIQAHLVQLKLNPDDVMTRLKLADKYVESHEYEKAVIHFEKAYQQGDFQKTDVEAKLIRHMTGLYRKEKNAGNYDKAIEYFNRLQSISGNMDMKELYRLEFDRDKRNTSPDDIETRVKMALGMKEKGLEADARQELERLRRQNPENPIVLAAMTTYAMELLGKAKEARRTLEYERALIYSRQLISEYHYLPEIRDEAIKIQNLTSVDLQKERQKKAKEALNFLAQAEIYYQQGVSFLRQYKSNQVDNTVFVVSYKQEAIKAYKNAVTFYDLADKYKAGLDEASRKTLSINRADAKRQVKLLTEPRKFNLPRTRKSRKL